MVKRTLDTAFAALYLTVFHCADCVADEQTKPINYRDIGRKCHIEGQYGKLYSDFNIKGIVRSNDPKDPAGTVRIDLTQIREERLDKDKKKRINILVISDSMFQIGSEVELVVREEAKLWYAEGIDAMVSNPDDSHLDKLFCVVSLHQRKLVSLRLPSKEHTHTSPEKGDDQSNTAPKANSDEEDNPFRPKPHR